MPAQMAPLIKQLYEIETPTLQVRPTKNYRVPICRTAIQPLDNVWGSLELILFIFQILTFCQSNLGMIPYKYLQNSTMKRQSNCVTRVTFNFITMKHVQLGIDVTQEHRANGNLVPRSNLMAK